MILLAQPIETHQNQQHYVSTHKTHHNPLRPIKTNKTNLRATTPLENQPMRSQYIDARLTDIRSTGSVCLFMLLALYKENTLPVKEK
jgi:hypothetical protein